VKITTGVPRANGQVERVNSTIISVLSKLCASQPGDWYKHVSGVQRAINNTFHRSINATPFEVMFGVKMRTAEDARIRELIQQEMIDTFNDEREELRRQAKQQLERAAEESRRTFNRKRKVSEKYAVGDLVAIKRTQFGSGLKLSPKFLGPYKVVTVQGNDRYEVKKCGQQEGPAKTSSSADNMKRFVPCESGSETESEEEMPGVDTEIEDD
jgi:hypothetical protein